MSKSTSVTHLFSLFFLSLIFMVVSGCGSDGFPGDSVSNTVNQNAAGTGSVALMLTDAPSGIFEEINIIVTRAELISDSGHVTIFQGERTFNLLDLTDARIFAIREGIAAGSYNKIRLTLSDIELVDYDDQADPNNYLTYHPKLPGNGKLDLKPKENFDIVAGGTLAIQIDMDANKSIHIVGTGNDKYKFRPVVFINIVTDAFANRFVKLHGNINTINDIDQSFNLCNTNIPVQMGEASPSTTSSSCVRVTTDNTTSIFDIKGKPAMFGALFEGEQATVFGLLQRDQSSQNIDNNDDARQLDDLVLMASLIELESEGGFLKLNGAATSVVDIADQFTMSVDPGQVLATDTPPLIINVQIQDGTIVINRQGSPVAITDIDTDILTVRGVYYVDTNTLFVSLIIVDTDSSSQLTGVVVANPGGSCGGFTLADINDGDRSVSTDINTKAFLVTASSSTPIGINELVSGQQADVYGNFDNGCFVAHTIIAY